MTDKMHCTGNMLTELRLSLLLLHSFQCVDESTTVVDEKRDTYSSEEPMTGEQQVKCEMTVNDTLNDLKSLVS